MDHILDKLMNEKSASVVERFGVAQGFKLALESYERVTVHGLDWLVNFVSCVALMRFE